MAKGPSESSMYENWRKYALMRDSGACVIPDKDCSGKIEVDHFIGRRCRLLRWDHDNSNCLCRFHHVNKEAYMDRIIAHMGEERHDRLRQIYITPLKKYLIDNGYTSQVDFLIKQKESLKEAIAKLRCYDIII